METIAHQELVKQSIGKEDNDDSRSNEKNNVLTNHTIETNNIDFHSISNLKNYQKWLRIATFTLLLLVGQTTAVLLGRLYFAKGGNSKWMATFVQTAGFPILIPLKFFFFSKNSLTRPSLAKLALLYFVFGLIVTGDNLMYSYGLSYLPVSTYSLLCASQLAFNAITSYLINAQKFTALVVNSVVILTISACLLAINAKNEGDNTSDNLPRGKFVVGFLCTIGASATYSFLLSVAQYSFEKVIKDDSFDTVVCMQLYPCMVATCGCVIGLFGSGEWSTLKGEMRGFENGRVPYVMVLASTAICWQLAAVGLLGLINEVSSLFSNVISTLCLPLVPICAVVFFHDKMNGVKVISLLLAMWGFLSYIYQHYLDNTKVIKASKEDGNDEILGATIEMC